MINRFVFKFAVLSCKSHLIHISSLILNLSYGCLTCGVKLNYNETKESFYPGFYMAQNLKENRAPKMETRKTR